MLSIGKMKPESMTDGSRDAKVARVNAICCESDTVETKIPMLVDVNKKIKVVNVSSK
jgi:hypothetical protein